MGPDSPPLLDKLLSAELSPELQEHMCMPSLKENVPPKERNSIAL